MVTPAVSYCNPLDQLDPAQRRLAPVNDPITNITEYLAARKRGEPGAAYGELPDLVYRELRRIATKHMSMERADHTLQPTALVHELFLRLAGNQTDWQSRAHFYAVCAQIMRGILIDSARARKTLKRGAGACKVELPEADVADNLKFQEFMDLHEALNRLAVFDLRQSQIVEMRFFGGMTEAEIAEVLSVSERTVNREWKIAKAWLFGELKKK